MGSYSPIQPLRPTPQPHSPNHLLPCSFDGVDIGSDGTVPFRSGERISFTYLISQKYTGDEASVAGLPGRRFSTWLPS